MQLSISYLNTINFRQLFDFLHYSLFYNESIRSKHKCAKILVFDLNVNMLEVIIVITIKTKI